MNSNKFKNLRINNKILQKDLGNALGISSSTVGMYESGRREPSNEMLKKIANYFEVSMDYLCDNETYKIKSEMELLEKKALKNVLIKAGYMKDNEDISEKELKNLIEFAKANKKFIKEKK